MRLIIPRVISGNRGDLASRWGLLLALHQCGIRDVAVFSRLPEDVPGLPYQRYPYGRVRNLFPDRVGRAVFRPGDTVLWSVGLDMQDDSSLAKLAYLWLRFRMYRRQGLRIWCLFQGAGPLSTRLGRWFASGALGCVDTFVARDPGTEHLVRGLSHVPKVLLGHDAIFLPGFEEEIAQPMDNAELIDLLRDDTGPLVGLNIRQWFHFSSSFLPYELARRAYQERSQAQMKVLLDSVARMVQLMRSQTGARVLLLSAYQPGIVPWEDDLPWLAEIKQHFVNDPRVVLLETPMTMPDYYRLMNRLDLMIGMRLHSSLVALRFGVPALNISYTLKGGDIYRHLGLADQVVDLQQAVESPEQIASQAGELLADLPSQRERVRFQVVQAIAHNQALLSGLLADQGEGDQDG